MPLSPQKHDLRVFDTPDALGREAASIFHELSVKEIERKRFFTVALSGGNTPGYMLTTLSGELREKIPWGGVHLFWGDERCVPPADRMSNYGAAKRLLIDNVEIPAENVHPMRGEGDPHEAALEYEREIMYFFAKAEMQTGRAFTSGAGKTGFNLPAFDLVFLGIGADGHTLSLFPHSRALDERKRLVTADYAGKKGWRITMALPLVNNASKIVFMVSGREKAESLKAVLEGDEALPAARIRPRAGDIVWLADREAAAFPCE